MKSLYSLLTAMLVLLIFSCDPTEEKNIITIEPWIEYDETAELEENAASQSIRMRYKLIQSRVTDRNETWKNAIPQIADFSDAEYEQLKPLILEQPIMTIQEHIETGKLTHEQLVKWYLFRIVKFENDKNKFLNAIIAINPDAVAKARECDQNRSETNHPIFGMPVLLKDNINFAGLPTTAGAVALRDNLSERDAFITERIEEKGGIILGKVNLSEWANYLADVNPNGYSAIGGQTLNPYGRRRHDTGGSSAASGVAMAANYAAAAVGTETAGSILSPSSSNSVVGLKPTIGLLSRSGIVPISGTLDTPGPMTRTVTDNAILLSAMAGMDESDPAATDNSDKNIAYWKDLKSGRIKGKKLGVIKRFLADSIYQATVEKIRNAGVIIIEIDSQTTTLSGFVDLLSADMKKDLPAYLNDYGSENVKFRTVDEIVTFNLSDTTRYIPYGQGRFDHIVSTDLTAEEHEELWEQLHRAGTDYLGKQIDKYELDAILSVNNWSAGVAAVAQFPCLTVPMGYTKTGTPMGITFIAKPYQEEKLLQLGFAFEKLTDSRKLPEDFR